jgi:hypothetical protein
VRERVGGDGKEGMKLCRSRLLTVLHSQPCPSRSIV